MVIPITTGKSKARTPANNSLPNPFHAKTISINKVPAINEPTQPEIAEMTG